MPSKQFDEEKKQILKQRINAANTNSSRTVNRRQADPRDLLSTKQNKKVPHSNILMQIIKNHENNQQVESSTTTTTTTTSNQKNESGGGKTKEESNQLMNCLKSASEMFDDDTDDIEEQKVPKVYVSHDHLTALNLRDTSKKFQEEQQRKRKRKRSQNIVEATKRDVGVLTGNLSISSNMMNSDQKNETSSILTKDTHEPAFGKDLICQSVAPVTCNNFLDFTVRLEQQVSNQPGTILSTSSKSFNTRKNLSNATSSSQTQSQQRTLNNGHDIVVPTNSQWQRSLPSLLQYITHCVNVYEDSQREQCNKALGISSTKSSVYPDMRKQSDYFTESRNDELHFLPAVHVKQISRGVHWIFNPCSAGDSCMAITHFDFTAPMMAYLSPKEYEKAINKHTIPVQPNLCYICLLYLINHEHHWQSERAQSCTKIHTPFYQKAGVVGEYKHTAMIPTLTGSVDSDASAKKHEVTSVGTNNCNGLTLNIRRFCVTDYETTRATVRVPPRPTTTYVSSSSHVGNMSDDDSTGTNVSVEALEEKTTLLCLGRESVKKPLNKISPYTYMHHEVEHSPSTSEILRFYFSDKNKTPAMGLPRLRNPHHSKEGIDVVILPIYWTWRKRTHYEKKLKNIKAFSKSIHELEIEHMPFHHIFCKDIRVTANNIYAIVRGGRIDIRELDKRYILNCPVDLNKPLSYFSDLVRNSERYKGKTLLLAYKLRCMILKTLKLCYKNTTGLSDATIHARLDIFCRWNAEQYGKKLFNLDSHPPVYDAVKDVWQYFPQHLNEALCDKYIERARLDRLAQKEMKIYYFASDFKFFKIKSSIKTRKTPLEILKGIYKTTAHSWVFVEFKDMVRTFVQEKFDHAFILNKFEKQSHFAVDVELRNIPIDIVVKNYSILWCLVVRLNTCYELIEQEKVHLDIALTNLRRTEVAYLKQKSQQNLDNKSDKRSDLIIKRLYDNFMRYKKQEKEKREHIYNLVLFVYTHINLSQRMFSDRLRKDSEFKSKANRDTNKQFNKFLKYYDQFASRVDWTDSTTIDDLIGYYNTFKSKVECRAYTDVYNILCAYQKYEKLMKSCPFENTQLCIKYYNEFVSSVGNHTINKNSDNLIVYYCHFKESVESNKFENSKEIFKYYEILKYRMQHYKRDDMFKYYDIFKMQLEKDCDTLDRNKFMLYYNRFKFNVTRYLDENFNRFVTHYEECYPWSDIMPHEGMLPDIAYLTTCVNFIDSSSAEIRTEKPPALIYMWRKFLPKCCQGRNKQGKHIYQCDTHISYARLTRQCLEFTLIGCYRSANIHPSSTNATLLRDSLTFSYSEREFLECQRKCPNIGILAMSEALVFWVNSLTAYYYYILSKYPDYNKYERRIQLMADYLRELINKYDIKHINELYKIEPYIAEAFELPVESFLSEHDKISTEISQDNASHVYRSGYINPITKLCKLIAAVNENRAGTYTRPEMPKEIRKAVMARVRTLKFNSNIELPSIMHEFNFNAKVERLEELNVEPQAIIVIMSVLSMIQTGESDECIESELNKIPPKGWEIFDLFVNMLHTHYSINVIPLDKETTKLQREAVMRRYKTRNLSPGAYSIYHTYCCNTMKTFDAHSNGSNFYGHANVALDTVSGEIRCKCDRGQPRRKKKGRQDRTQLDRLITDVSVGNTGSLIKFCRRHAKKQETWKTYASYRYQPRCGEYPPAVIPLIGNVAQITEIKYSSNTQDVPITSAFTICPRCGAVAGFSRKLNGINGISCGSCDYLHQLMMVTPQCVACDRFLPIQEQHKWHRFFVLNDDPEGGSFQFEPHYVCDRCKSTRTSVFDKRYIHTKSELKKAKMSSKFSPVLNARNGEFDIEATFLECAGLRTKLPNAKRQKRSHLADRVAYTHCMEVQQQN